MDSTFPFVTSCLKSVYGTVIDCSPPGLRTRKITKFATRIATNQSQVLRGGILRPAPGVPPGAPPDCPVRAGTPARAFCCPVKAIVIPLEEEQRWITPCDLKDNEP